LDIEAGSSTGYAAFVTRLRNYMKGYKKRLYIMAAPQCPFPDYYLGQVLNEVAFDAVYVQFCMSRSITLFQHALCQGSDQPIIL
jgi:chitinase